MPSFTIGKPLEVHPLLAEQTTARDFWRRSDRARWDYSTGADAQGMPILPKHEREPEDRFGRRKRQALVRRYARPILDRYNDFVTREEPKRPDGGAPYQQLLKDADGAGSSLTKLMKLALRKSQVSGQSYQLADANDDRAFVSAQEEQQAGKRGIVRSVDPDDVIWWRDWQGSVIEAVILCASREGGQFAWYVTETFCQRIDLKREKSGKRWVVESIGEEAPHSYKGCPLVRLAPSFDDECPGEDSQCAPLAEGQKRICNMDSWLLEELQGCTFTTQAFLGVSADQVKEATAGPGMAICLPSNGGANPSVQRLGSDVAQAQSLRDSLTYEIKELYRVAGLSPGNPTESAQPESGVAKAFAFNEIEAKCAALADATESAENRLVWLLSNGFGWAYPGDSDYPNRFDVPDLAAELSICLQMQTVGLPNVLQRAQVERVAASGFELTGEQKQTLAAELDAKQAQALKAKQSEIINPPSGPLGT